MENEKNIQAVNLQLIQAEYDDDQISLLDMCKIVMVYKYHILLIVICCFSVALFYALTLPPAYQANAFLIPPRSSDIDALNININLGEGSKFETEYTVDQVHEEFIKTFKSRAVRYQFFKDNNLLEKFTTEEQTNQDVNVVFSEQFDLALNINNTNDEFNKQEMIASLSAYNADLAAEVLNDYIAYSNQVTARTLVKNVEHALENKKNDITQKLAVTRVTASKIKADVVSLLSDALITAGKLDIKSAGNLRENAQEHLNNANDNLMLELMKKPLYTRGVDALSAEISSIEQKKNLDSYMPYLRLLEEQVSILEGYLLQIKNIETFNTSILDQEALPPRYRLKPKRKLIVGTGIAIGIVLALVFAFFAHIVQKALRQY